MNDTLFDGHRFCQTEYYWYVSAVNPDDGITYAALFEEKMPERTAAIRFKKAIERTGETNAHWYIGIPHLTIREAREHRFKVEHHSLLPEITKVVNFYGIEPSGKCFTGTARTSFEYVELEAVEDDYWIVTYLPEGNHYSEYSPVTIRQITPDVAHIYDHNDSYRFMGSVKATNDDEFARGVAIVCEMYYANKGRPYDYVS